MKNIATFIVSFFFMGSVCHAQEGHYTYGHSSTDHVKLHRPAPSYTKNQLFFIQKNTNTSVVVYDANRNKQGRIDEDDPIHIYWVRYNEDSLPGELSYFQRKMAYGVSVKETSRPGVYDFQIVSYKKKTIRIFKNDKDEVQANMPINGKMARFRRVFLQIERDFLFPEISYVEIFGEDLETGEPVYERMTMNE